MPCYWKLLSFFFGSTKHANTVNELECKEDSLCPNVLRLPCGLAWTQSAICPPPNCLSPYTNITNIQHIPRTPTKLTSFNRLRCVQHCRNRRSMVNTWVPLILPLGAAVVSSAAPPGPPAWVFSTVVACPWVANALDDRPLDDSSTYPSRLSSW